MNATGIELYINPRDEQEFDELTEASTDNSSPYGLLSISSGAAHPSELYDVTHCRFVGMHGSHAGDYPARLVWCFGDEVLHAHPCDEDGNISIPGLNPWEGDYVSGGLSLFEGVDTVLVEARRALHELVAEVEKGRDKPRTTY